MPDEIKEKFSIWEWLKNKTKSVLTTAGIIIIGGITYFVGMGADGRPYLVNPNEPKDTLWAKDTTEFNKIISVEYPYVYAYAKRGDVIGSDAKASFFDGYVVEVIDPNMEGWHNAIVKKQWENKRALDSAEMEDLLFPPNGKMRKAYSIIRAKRGSPLADSLFAATTPTSVNDKVADYRSKTKYIDYSALADSIPNLITDVRGAENLKIIDGAKISNSVFKNTKTISVSAKVANPIEDKNTISKGEYTIGADGDYATVTAFMADMAALDSAITGVIISSHTLTATATSNVACTGKTFTLRNHANGSHHGNTADGYIISIEVAAAGLNMVLNGSLNVFEGLSLKRTSAATTTAAIVLSQTTNASNHYLNNIVINTVGVATSRGIVFSGIALAGIQKILNCLIITEARGIVGSATQNPFIENCFVSSAKAEAVVLIANSASIVRNCVMIGGIINTDSATGINNATDNATGANASWKTGTGNLTAINTTNEFISKYATSANCGRLKNTGVLWNGGVSPTYAGVTDLAGNARFGSDSAYSIGAFIYVQVVPPAPVKLKVENWSLKWKGTDTAYGYHHEAKSGTVISTYAGRIARSYTSDTKSIFVNGGQSNLLADESVVTIYGHWMTFLDSLHDFIADTGCHVYHIGMPMSTSTSYNDSMEKIDSLLARKKDSLTVAFSGAFTYHFFPGPYDVDLVAEDPWHPTKTGYNEWLGILRDSLTPTLQNKSDTAIEAGQSLMLPRGLNHGFQFTTDSLGRTDTTTNGQLWAYVPEGDSIWFAVGDTSTWHKYKAKADSVYDIGAYLVDSSDNNIFWRASNVVGVGAVLSGSIYAECGVTVNTTTDEAGDSIQLTISACGGDTTARDTFYTAPGGAPIITSVSPSVGVTHGWLADTLRGSGFGATRGTGWVKYGTKNALQYFRWTDKMVVAETPPNDRATYNVILRNNAGGLDTLVNGFRYRRINQN